MKAHSPHAGTWSIVIFLHPGAVEPHPCGSYPVTGMEAIQLSACSRVTPGLLLFLIVICSNSYPRKYHDEWSASTPPILFG